MKKVIINASDIHGGGGKVMLNDLLFAAITTSGVEFHVFTDKRYNKTEYSAPHVHYHGISKWKRLLVDRMIRKHTGRNTIVINIGDMPPLRRHDCTVIQFLMNRYFIDNYSMKGMSLTVKIRLTAQKWAFRSYLKNADHYFVQNHVMKDLLKKLGYENDVIRVIPYKNIDPADESSFDRRKDSFIYVASDEPHKNHKNLITAWGRLKQDGLKPSLYLTIDDSTELSDMIMEKIKQEDLDIRIKPKLPRAELLKLYQQVGALIYPSFFECFGIPMIEARNFGLPVIAAELDFVRDLIEPVQTFDPHSPRSIARAVKRFLSEPDQLTEVISADQFMKELLGYERSNDD